MLTREEWLAAAEQAERYPPGYSRTWGWGRLARFALLGRPAPDLVREYG